MGFTNTRQYVPSTLCVYHVNVTSVYKSQPHFAIHLQKHMFMLRWFHVLIHTCFVYT